MERTNFIKRKYKFLKGLYAMRVEGNGHWTMVTNDKY